MMAQKNTLSILNVKALLVYTWWSFYGGNGKDEFNKWKFFFLQIFIYDSPFLSHM